MRPHGLAVKLLALTLSLALPSPTLGHMSLRMSGRSFSSSVPLTGLPVTAISAAIEAHLAPGYTPDSALRSLYEARLKVSGEIGNTVALDSLIQALTAAPDEAILANIAALPPAMRNRVADAAAGLRALGEKDPAFAKAVEALRLSVTEPKTKKAAEALPALLARFQQAFPTSPLPGLSGSDADVIVAPVSMASTLAPLPGLEAPLSSAKIVAQLRDMLKHDRPAALAKVEQLLGQKGDRRVEVRLGALRAAAELGGERGVKLLTANLSGDDNMYARRESAKLLGEASIPVSEKEAAMAALRSALEQHAQPGSKPGWNDSLFLMAAWSYQKQGGDVGPFFEARKRGMEARDRRDGWREEDERRRREMIENPGWDDRELKGASQEKNPIRSRVMWAILALSIIIPIIMIQSSGTPPAPPRELPPVSQLDREAKRPADSVAPAPKAEVRPKTTDDRLEDIAQALKRQADLQERDQQMRFQQWLQQQQNQPGVMSWILPILLILGGSVLIQMWFMRRQGGGGSNLKTGKFSVEPTRHTTRFDEVAGADDARTEVMEIVDFLRNPKKYRKLNPELPKGALLVGPPGTGKTMLAKAVAGETGANFFSMAGSDFVEMFVGVGASRMRELFDVAKKHAPAIIFIDEIDAVGKKRGTGVQSNDERENTLNQLLVAMDGFDNSTGVVILAATNREDVLDPALLRPGRFDRKIHVGLPDVLGREAILAIHSGRTALAADVSLEEVAKRTSGLSGAFLKNVVNEGALIGSRRDADAVSASDIDKGIAKNTIGGERNLFIPTETKQRIADHEVGHVLVGWYTSGKRPNKVTVIPHGPGALGYAESGDDSEFITDEDQLRSRLATLMGGRAAEKMKYRTYSTGAGNDLEVATNIARAMVERLGMGQGTGFSNKAPDPNGFGGKRVSEATAERVDAEVDRLLAEAEATAVKILTDHAAEGLELSKHLMKHETLFGEEIERVVKKVR